MPIGIVKKKRTVLCSGLLAVVILGIILIYVEKIKIFNLDFIDMPNHFVLNSNEMEASGSEFEFKIDNPDDVVGYSITNIKAENHLRYKINDFSKSSIGDMLDYVGRGKDDKETAILWMNYINRNKRWGSRLLANSSFSNPLLFFINGGYGVCSDFARSMAIAMTKAGVKSRIVHISGKHAVYEAFYKDSWHMFDPSEGVFFLDNVGKVVSVEEIIENTQLIQQMSSVWNKKEKNIEFIRDVYEDGEIINLEYEDSFMFHFKDDEVTYDMYPGDSIYFFYEWKDKNLLENYNSLLLKIVNGMYVSEMKTSIHNWNFYRELDFPHLINAVYLKSKLGCFAIREVFYSTDGGNNWQLANDKCVKGHVEIFDSRTIDKGNVYNKIIIKGKSFSNVFLNVEFQLGSDGIQPINKGVNTVQFFSDKDTQFVKFDVLSRV